MSMEGLSTSQALRYMRALRASVQRSKNQFLSAAWNLNKPLTDNYDCNVSCYCYCCSFCLSVVCLFMGDFSFFPPFPHANAVCC